MKMVLSSEAELDDSKISTAIDLKISLEVMTHSLPRKTQEYMSLLLSKYLEECGLASYYPKLNYCLSEILLNAIKANMKRVYFIEKNLDIHKSDDYAEGMKDFRKETLGNREHYFEELRARNLYVSYSLKIDKGRLIIDVRNNTVMTEKEAERVKEKMTMTRPVTPEDLMTIAIDETEGAGLGLKSVMLTLNSFGLPGDHFQLFTEGDETVARVIIESPEAVK